MSLLFPRFQEFSPFFRLADELDRATRAHQQNGLSGRSFAPRFDVKETKDAYELHGELPGVEQSNINIEWTDEATLNISGHTEKRYESTNAEDVTEVEEASPSASTEQPHAYHKPSVEDAKEGAETTTVAKTEAKPVAKSQEPRYWVTERSFGSFNRTFQFPSRVDHDGVKASLKNGILAVIVPKAKAREPRKVTIT